MRALAVGGLLAAFGLYAAPAYATFHLEKVNEVMLASSTGDSSVQFVELLDKGGTEEAFTPVFAPYRLTVYDAAGKLLGAQTLDPNGLRAAAGSASPYLISTPAADAAFNVKGDERLTVTMPAVAGQACFEGSPGAVSCITWGTIVKPVPINSQGTGSAHGPVPPPGESDQRRADDSIIAAAPTPRAANATTAAPAPATAAPFAGVTFTARIAHVDRRGRARVRLSCPAAASGSCDGRLRLLPAGHGRKFGEAAFAIAAGHTGSVLVRLSHTARRQLAKTKRLKARGVASASDASGASKQTSRALTLTTARTQSAPAPTY